MQRKKKYLVENQEARWRANENSRIQKSREECKEVFWLSARSLSCPARSLLHGGDAGVAVFNAAKEPWPCMIRAEVTHSFARSWPIDRGTWYPEARSLLLSRRHRAAIFFGAPLAYAAVIVRGNEITGNAGSAPGLIVKEHETSRKLRRMTAHLSKQMPSELRTPEPSQTWTIP